MGKPQTALKSAPNTTIENRLMSAEERKVRDELGMPDHAPFKMKEHWAKEPVTVNGQAPAAYLQAYSASLPKKYQAEEQPQYQ